jgi:hypothetical protein
VRPARRRIDRAEPFGEIRGDRWGRCYEQGALYFDAAGVEVSEADFVGPIPEEHLLAQLRADAEARQKEVLLADYEARVRARRIARAQVIIEAAKAVIAEYHRPHPYHRPHSYNYHGQGSCGIPDDGLGDLAFDHHLMFEVDAMERLDAGEDALPLLLLDDNYSLEYSAGERP